MALSACFEAAEAGFKGSVDSSMVNHGERLLGKGRNVWNSVNPDVQVIVHMTTVYCDNSNWLELTWEDYQRLCDANFSRSDFELVAKAVHRELMEAC